MARLRCVQPLWLSGLPDVGRTCAPFEFPRIQGSTLRRFYIDEWPGEIISFVNSLEPGGFCWEARRAMEVPNGRFNAREFVYIGEVLLAIVHAHLECHMVAGDLVCFDGVHGVEAVLNGWMIQDESVRVEVGDNGDQGDAPKICAGATPSFEYCFPQDCDFGGF